MNSLVKATKNQVVTSKSASGAAGKGLVAVGGVGLLLGFLAMVLPFVGVFGISLALMALGIFMWE